MGFLGSHRIHAENAHQADAESLYLPGFHLWVPGWASILLSWVIPLFRGCSAMVHLAQSRQKAWACLHFSEPSPGPTHFLFIYLFIYIHTYEWIYSFIYSYIYFYLHRSIIVALISDVQQRDSVIHTYISVFFRLFSLIGYYEILSIQNIDYSWCYTVGPCWLAINTLHIVVIHVNPKCLIYPSPLPFPFDYLKFLFYSLFSFLFVFYSLFSKRRKDLRYWPRRRERGGEQRAMWRN